MILLCNLLSLFRSLQYLCFFFSQIFIIFFPTFLISFFTQISCPRCSSRQTYISFRQPLIFLLSSYYCFLSYKFLYVTSFFTLFQLCVTPVHLSYYTFYAILTHYDFHSFFIWSFYSSFLHTFLVLFTDHLLSSLQLQTAYILFFEKNRPPFFENTMPFVISFTL